MLSPSRFEAMVADAALRSIGLSPARVALALLSLCATLLLLFVFIFLGINAFTTGTSFGAVVNSIIPALTGVGVALGSSAQSAASHQRSLNSVAKKQLSA